MRSHSPDANSACGSIPARPRGHCPRGNPTNGGSTNPTGRFRAAAADSTPGGMESILVQLFRKIESPTRLARNPATPPSEEDSFTLICARKAAITSRRQLFCATFPTLPIAGFVALL